MTVEIWPEKCIEFERWLEKTGWVRRRFDESRSIYLTRFSAGEKDTKPEATVVIANSALSEQKNVDF